MHGEVPLNARRKNIAARLRLQILVAADVIRIGMRVIDCAQPPAVCIENLADLAPCLLVVSAVDEANIVAIELDQPDLCGALDVVAAFRDLV